MMARSSIPQGEDCMRQITIALSMLGLVTGSVACGGGSSPETTTTTTTTGSETAATESAPRFAQISVDEVATALDTRQGEVAVFDANSPETYAEHHVPGATWVDYDSLSAEQLPEDRSTQLVFYCANEQCEASHVAAEAATNLGYQNVAVMGAGIQGWIAAGKPVETATTSSSSAQ
jgi:rhodanese-related sulfurtransferase